MEHKNARYSHSSTVGFDNINDHIPPRRTKNGWWQSTYKRLVRAISGSR